MLNVWRVAVVSYCQKLRNAVLLLRNDTSNGQSLDALSIHLISYALLISRYTASIVYVVCC